MVGLFVFLEARYLRIDGSMAKNLITPCLLLIWMKNNCGEESQEPPRQWEKGNLLAVRLGGKVRAAVAVSFRVHRFEEWCLGFFVLFCLRAGMLEDRWLKTEIGGDQSNKGVSIEWQKS